MFDTPNFCDKTPTSTKFKGVIVTTLNDLAKGSAAKVLKIQDRDILNSRLRDIGIVPGAEIIIVKSAPLGDPLEIKVNDSNVSIRLKEAEKVLVEAL